MTDEKFLRDHLWKLLDWEDAHVNFDTAVEDLPASKRGMVPQGFAHSPWQLVEHLRLTQFDILDFCRNPAYSQPPMEQYWPSSAAPSDDAVWEASIERFRRDRESLKQLSLDESLNLFDQIPHGSGQTYLRELLLVADHNAYHVAQLVAVRRALGAWEAP